MIQFALHELEAFIYMAEASTMVEAADRLRIAQPALSRKLQRLEHVFGVALFKRGHNRMTLTPAGERFLVDARYILEFCRYLERAMRQYAAPKPAPEPQRSRHHHGPLPRANGRGKPKLSHCAPSREAP